MRYGTPVNHGGGRIKINEFKIRQPLTKFFLRAFQSDIGFELSGYR